MTEFPSSEADELVTKDFLRAELALTTSELRSEMVGLRVDIADLRNELTRRLIAVVATATAMLGTLITLT